MNTADTTMEKMQGFGSARDLSFADAGGIVSSAGPLAAARRGIWRALATIGFVAFSAVTVLAMAYLVSLFQNESYKAVVIFLTIITVSNVGSKYGLWMMKQ